LTTLRSVTAARAADRHGRGFRSARCAVRAAGLLLLTTLCGCASAPAPRAVPLEAAIQVSEGLNPDADGRASPLVLVFYQLRAADTFRGLDFFAVFDPEGRTLAADLVSREQLTLAPGEDRVYRTELDPEATHLGVVGAFADLENATWRDLFELPDRGLLGRVNVFQRDRLSVQVSERAVAFVVDD
jgi:type VI secretion system protein VasD